MNNRLLFVSQERQNEINKLRMAAYKEASGFHVDLSTLKWKTSDDQSYIMAAESNGALISTMRGEVIDDLSLLEKKLECPWHFPLTLEMSILLLSRAATLPQHRAHGMNLILRYWFIRFAIEQGIDFILGTFVAGSAREKTLHQMGYQFFENTLGWQQSTYRSLRPVYIVVLNLKTDGEKALHYCQQYLATMTAQYSFDQPFPPLRYVRSL